MKTWLRYLVWSLEMAIVLAVVYFEPTYGVRGILWREAFFDGKSTSYWREELERWDVKTITMRRSSPEWCASQPRIRFRVYIRRQSWLEEQRERWLNPSDALPQPSSVGIIKGPEILGAGADEAPVLQALLDDPSRKVRLFAQIGLGMDPPIPGDD